jgi:hypothetical protein
MSITTTESLNREHQGQVCHVCTKRSALCRWKDGTGWLCPDCDPRENLVTLVDDDRPVDRGRG